MAAVLITTSGLNDPMTELISLAGSIEHVFEKEVDLIQGIFNSLSESEYARMRTAFISFNEEAFLHADFATRTKQVLA